MHTLRGGFAGSWVLLLVCAGCSTPSGFDGGTEPIVVLDGGADGGRDAGGTVDAGPFVTAPHPPWPVFVNDGGPVLTQARLVSIAPGNLAHTASYFAFADGLASSGWWNSFRLEYGVGLADAGVHLNGAPINSAGVQISDLVAYVQATVDGGIPLDGTNLFLVYLPFGTSLLPDLPCGYHTPYPDVATSTGDALLAVADNCLQLVHNQTDAQMVTNAASHEIAEATTDPLLNAFRLPRFNSFTDAAWQAYARGAIEIGDLCEGTRVLDAAGNEYQRIFSNAAAASGGDPCVPANGQIYFNTSPDADWHGVDAGDAVDIPFTGWSTDATTDWNVNPHLVSGSPTFLDAGAGIATVNSPLGLGCNRSLINNGVTATLHVVVPATALSGEWTVFSIHSYLQSANCVVAPQPDAYHPWPIGVFVR